MENKKAPGGEQGVNHITVDVQALSEDIKEVMRFHMVPEEFYIKQLVYILHHFLHTQPHVTAVGTLKYTTTVERLDLM